MDKHGLLTDYLAANAHKISQVIPFNPESDRFYHFNFTENNQDLTAADIADTANFSKWIESKLRNYDCRYGIGGYMEHRTLYQRSALFNTADEPRRLHLGADIWAPANTHIYAPLAGVIHSFQDNNHFGDYGPTIILQHDLNGLVLYSLYGHLSRVSLSGLKEGDMIESGQKIGELGHEDENGSWPPHLHFQLMFDLQGMRGDYPGVGKYSEKDLLINNIPDPQILLQIPAANIIG